LASKTKCHDTHAFLLCFFTAYTQTSSFVSCAPKALPYLSGTCSIDSSKLKNNNKCFAKSIDIHYLSQNITLMSAIIENQTLEAWADEQLSKGKYSFSLDTLRDIFAGQSHP